MADDLNKRGQPDRSLINLSEAHEVQYWTVALGVSEAELAALVRQVGNSAERVREALASRR